MHMPLMMDTAPVTAQPVHFNGVGSCSESYHSSSSLENDNGTVCIDAQSTPSAYVSSAKPVSIPSAVQGLSEKSLSNSILDIIFDYALNKFCDTKDRLEAGRE